MIEPIRRTTLPVLQLHRYWFYGAEYRGVVVRGAALLVAAAALAGCGGHAVAQHAATACKLSPAGRRALRHVEADVVAIRRAARLPAHDTMHGDAATNRATDAFLRDVETAPIDNLRRNRLIDHAAAALVGTCQLCFSSLEAVRPVITIRFRHGAGCAH